MVLNKARTAMADPIFQQNEALIINGLNQNKNYVLDVEQADNDIPPIAPPHHDSKMKTNWNVNAQDFYPRDDGRVDNSSVVEMSYSVMTSEKCNKSPIKGSYRASAVSKSRGHLM